MERIRVASLQYYIGPVRSFEETLKLDGGCSVTADPSPPGRASQGPLA